MKKEIELETGVFVPPKKENQDIPGTLGSAREILRRVLLEAGSAPVRSDPAKTENGENASAEIPGETPLSREATAFSAVSAPVPGLVRGAVLPGNPVFRTAGETGKTLQNTVLEQVSLELTDQREAVTAGMEATLKVQQEILRAILGIRIGDETIARANERYARKMAVAEGGVL